MRKILSIIISFLILSVLVVWVIVPNVKTIISDKKEEKQDQIDEFVKFNDMYAFWLFITGDYDVQPEKIEILKLNENPTKARIYIYYYNIFNDEKITYEMLVDEYKVFCEGKNEYPNLEKYVEYMERMQYREPQRVGDEYYFSLKNFYEVSTLYIDEDNNELPEEDVLKVCNYVYESRMELYQYAIIQSLKESSVIRLGYEETPLCCGYTDDEVTVLSDNFAIIDNGTIKLYLTKGEWIWLGNSETWVVTKVELVEKTSFEELFGGSVGDTYEEIKNGIGSELEEETGFSIKIDTPEKLVFSREDMWLITFELNGKGVCTKAVLELVVD